MKGIKLLLAVLLAPLAFQAAADDASDIARAATRRDSTATVTSTRQKTSNTDNAPSKQRHHAQQTYRNPAPLYANAHLTHHLRHAPVMLSHARRSPPPRKTSLPARQHQIFNPARHAPLTAQLHRAPPYRYHAPEQQPHVLRQNRALPRNRRAHAPPPPLTC